MRLILSLLAVVALSACSSGPRELAKPDGNVFRFNATKWEETMNQMTTPPRRRVVH